MKYWFSLQKSLVLHEHAMESLSPVTGFVSVIIVVQIPRLLLYLSHQKNNIENNNIADMTLNLHKNTST